MSTLFPGPFPWLGGGASQRKGPGNEVVVMFDVCPYTSHGETIVFSVFSISFKSREASHFKGYVLTARELLRMFL